MNDLSIQEIKFDATVQTSIELQNEDTLNAMVEAVESKYKNLIYTDDNEKEAKSDRAELNKIAKRIDEERKRIKKVYNEPLAAFESKMNSYSKRINEVVKPIDTNLKDLERRQKEQRKKEIEDYILEVAPNYDLKPEEITIETSWLNKSHSNIKRQKLITDAMKLINIKKEERQREVDIVVAYCKALDLESSSWVFHLDNGRSATDVMQDVDKAIAQKKEQEQREAERKAKAEVLEQQTKEINVTEEVIQDTYIEPLEEVKTEPLQELVLKFTATSDQLNILSDFIISHGIQVEKL